MFEVIAAGMVYDMFDTYREAIEVALSLGVGAYVVKSQTTAW